MRKAATTWVLVALVLGVPSWGEAAKIKHKMIRKDDRPAVRKAIAKGANVNLFYVDGTNPLLAATRYGNLEMVRLLVESGADVQAKNQLGWSSLTIAARYGYPDIAEYLITNDAYVHTRNSQELTPLMLAAFGGHQEIVALLVEHGVRVDVANRAGKTALFYAASNQREEMVRFLLDRGAAVGRFEGGGEERFATAFALDVRGRRRAVDGRAEAAAADFRKAAREYERAAAELRAEADDLRRKAEGVQSAELGRAVLAGLLGLVAVHQDLNNIDSPNPTNYSGLYSDMISGPAEASSRRARGRIDVLRSRARRLDERAARADQLRNACLEPLERFEAETVEPGKEGDA